MTTDLLTPAVLREHGFTFNRDHWIRIDGVYDTVLMGSGHPDDRYWRCEIINTENNEPFPFDLDQDGTILDSPDDEVVLNHLEFAKPRKE